MVEGDREYISSTEPFGILFYYILSVRRNAKGGRNNEKKFVRFSCRFHVGNNCCGSKPTLSQWVESDEVAVAEEEFNAAYADAGLGLSVK